MPAGGCACGNIRISFDSEPSAKALCHCSDCKKISGSAYSTNIIIPNAGFNITSGTPKTWSKKADSGAEITTSFCGDCGTNMWRTTPTFGENRVLKVGILDGLDALNDAKPEVELYAPERVSWLPAQAGAAQFKGMPGSEQVA